VVAHNFDAGHGFAGGAGIKGPDGERTNTRNPAIVIFLAILTIRAGVNTGRTLLDVIATTLCYHYQSKNASY